ncbi:MAG: nitroreductase family protein [Theionarchaea archaeon]|nr:nitroreductase family protein [Theionarchaea archaeon]MBU7037471.1 nitroreductase family protein [Theionarchaea archaeon]
MDVFDAIRNRRSIRKYRKDLVEDEKIQKCLEAAQWAPSASNKQPWHFIVVRNENTRKSLSEMHPYGRFMKESPVVIVVLGDPDKNPKYFLMDACIATQNLLLAAHAQGLGTCWMGVIDAEFEKDMKALLGIHDPLRILCCVSMGYPDESRTSSRRPLSDMVSYDMYEK